MTGVSESKTKVCICLCWLMQIYFGTHHGKMYLTANFLGMNCASGMSTLFRKDIIDEAGGLASFGKYLAEDYMLAQAVLNRCVFFLLVFVLELCTFIFGQNVLKLM